MQERSKIVLVTGGSRSGKSKFAEDMLKNETDVLYIATSIPFDEEMKERIRKHRERRNKSWNTYEGYKNLDIALEENNEKFILLDCATIMITNILLEEKNIDNLSNEEIDILLNKIKREFRLLVDSAIKNNKQLIIVTNEVGCSLVPEYKLGRIFRDIAGSINQFLGEMSQEVYMVTCGIPMKLK